MKLLLDFFSMIEKSYIWDKLDYMRKIVLKK